MNARKTHIVIAAWLLFLAAFPLVPVMAATVGPTGPSSSVTATSTAVDAQPPSLEVSIPTVKFSNVSVEQNGKLTILNVPWLADYLSGIYKYAVGAAAVIAAALMMIGGFQYLTAGGDMGRVKSAKDRISNALVGLLIAVGSYLVANAINPDLTRFRTMQINMVRQQVFSAEEQTDYGDTAQSGSGQDLCHTIADCKKICDKGKTNWPTTSPGVMDPSLAKPIPTIPGLIGGSHTASQAVIDGLKRAAAIADAQGLTIRVTSGYRPLSTQLALVCDRVNDPTKAATIGKAVAWPGGSNHGKGYAVDVQLLRGSKVIVGSGDCAGQKSGKLATAADSQLLDQIMTQAGAVRYKNEIWHYEFGSSSSCRCSAGNCPSPPISCSGNC